MWIKKLKQKKLQFILIAMILVCITSIFTGCISFVLEINNSIKNYYTEDTCPESFFSSKGEDGIKAFHNYNQENDLVKDIILQEARMVSGRIRINGNLTPLSFPYFIGIENNFEFPYYFDLTDRSDKKELSSPEEGTVWVSSVWADLKGVQLGDTIEIDGDEKHNFIITGIFNTAICPSSTMALMPFFINFEDMQKIDDKQKEYFGTFSRRDQSTELEHYLKDLPKEFLETITVQYDRDSLELSFTMTTSILAGIGMIASFLIFIVSIIIIRFIIKSNLVKEYHSIGIYKSLGFQANEIIGFYLKCYLFTGVIGISIGALFGLLFAKVFSSLTLKYLGEFQLSYQSALCMLLLIPILTGILFINLYAAIHKIKKIHPVKALTMEMVSSKSTLKRSMIKNAHSPFAMAINDIFKRINSSVMIVAMLTIAFYLSIFFLMANGTMKTMNEYSNTWFTIPNPGCYVNGILTEQTEKEISNNQYVDKVIFGQLYMMLPLKVTDNPNILSNVTIFPYTNFDAAVTNTHYKEGRAPEKADEIAVSKDLIDKLERVVGDYIQLEINQIKKEYLITGVYNSMMNGGQNMHILTDTLDECGVSYQNNIAFVKLKNKSDYEAFQKDIEKNKKNIYVTNKIDAMEDSTKGVTEIVSPVTQILVYVFLGFSLLNIINLLLMNNIDNKRKYGILKALGFTNTYIRLQNIIKITILTIISTIFAIFIHFSVSSIIFESMIGVDGLINNIPLLSVLVGAIIIIIIMVVLLFTIPLNKISPTNLMEE